MATPPELIMGARLAEQSANEWLKLAAQANDISANPMKWREKCQVEARKCMDRADWYLRNDRAAA